MLVYLGRNQSLAYTEWQSYKDSFIYKRKGKVQVTWGESMASPEVSAEISQPMIFPIAYRKFCLLV